MIIEQKYIDRFLALIDWSGCAAGSTCWEWGGIRSSNGYGGFKFRRKTMSAHKFSYILHYGDIKPGLFVCHKCDNKGCVNPKHLFSGTAQDNAIDACNKGRAMCVNQSGDKHWTHRHPNKIKRGEDNNYAKLTWIKVKMIRLEYVYKSKTHGTDALAKKYKVNRATIWQIVNNKTWII